MFGWLRKEKVKTLALPEKYASGFIQPLTTRRLEIKLGEKLVVQKGWCAVIVVKDKPQDVFLPGEYELNLPSLPHTTRALKLDKSKIKKKKGESKIVFPSKFKCDLYFVNMAVIENQDWQASRISMKDKVCGRFNITMSGKFDFQTTDVPSTIKLFLLEWACIAPSKAQLRLQQYVGEFVAEAMEWGKVTSPEIINDTKQIGEIIAPIISKKFSKYGITISNFSVDKVDFGRDVTALLEQKRREESQQTNDNEIEQTTEKVEQTANNIEEINSDVTKDSVINLEFSTNEDKTEAIAENKEEKGDLFDKIVLDKDVKLDFDKIENEIAPKDTVKVEDIQEKEKEYFTDDFLSKKLRENKNKKENNAPMDFSTQSDEELLDGKSSKTENNKSNNNEELSQKICPKCGKVHDKNDQICECGCVLD